VWPVVTLSCAHAVGTMSCRAPASSPVTPSAPPMQEVAKSALSGCNCFDLLENALLTRITDLLSAKDLVRFAASCKRFAGLEKESSKLKHAQLCAHFTAAGAADTVAWLTSNRGRVFSTFIVVTGAPYSVLERLVEAPEHPPLLFPNSELFAALERRIAGDAKAIYAAMASARAVYAATLERGDDAGDARDAAAGVLNEQLDRHRPGKLGLDNADEGLVIWDSVQLDTLQRRGIQLTLHYEGDSFSNDVHEWRHSPSGGCSLRVQIDSRNLYGDVDFLDETSEFVFDNNTNMWLLAAGLYLEGTRWLEREVGREDAGYEWQSSSRAMETLRQMSENDPTLTELDFSEDRIGDAGVSALAEALKVNNALTTLNISDNSIGVDDASALAEALKVNNALTTLDISDNSIGVDDARALAEALKVNKMLTTLDVDNNSIGEAGASALAEALKVNKTLTKLNVGYNSISDAGARALAEALMVNKTLTKLNVGGNSIGASGALALAEALKVNNTRTMLNVWRNSIGGAGANILAEALKVNKTLTALNVGGNSISEAGFAVLLASARPGCKVFFTLAAKKR
jgi:Leucine Rich repeat